MYHLWYFPALLLSIFLVTKLIDRIGYQWTFFICSILFLIGSGETYFSYLEGTKLGQVYAAFFSIFITTKNGLFFGLIFTFIGFYLSDNFQKKIFIIVNEKKYL